MVTVVFGVIGLFCGCFDCYVCLVSFGELLLVLCLMFGLLRFGFGFELVGLLFGFSCLDLRLRGFVC